MALKRKTIEFNNLKFICNCRIIPFKGYSAINLFGKIYTRKSEEEVKRYLQTNNGRVWYRHEYMHTLQKESLGLWILFYILYLWYFFKAWPFFMKWKQAYRTIPFELEAYKLQNDNYDLSSYQSHWKHYIKSNKERKTTIVRR